MYCIVSAGRLVTRFFQHFFFLFLPKKHESYHSSANYSPSDCFFVTN